MSRNWMEGHKDYECCTGWNRRCSANTGNIGRTCVATGTKLHLIEPLGFKLNDKLIKRAGLDYWDKLDVTVYSDYQDFLDRNPGAKIYNGYHTKGFMSILMWSMNRTAFSCLEKKAPEFRKRSFWKTRTNV